MKKRVLAILAAAFILFNFAACGKTDTQSTTADTATTSATATTIAATEPETTQDPADARTGAGTTAATTKAATTAATTKAATTAAPTTQAPPATSAVKSFTKTELAKFDGKSGRDAYIAYSGTVYDVTSKLDRTWKNGEHHGLLAGTDLTEKVKNCSEHLKAFIEAQFSTYPTVGVYTG